MKIGKNNFQSECSTLHKKKFHNKITQHIKQIRKNNSVLSNQSKNAQKLPDKIVQKQKHKYLYKKALINTKFQWLNKYFQTSQLKSMSMNINSNQVNYSMVRDKNPVTSALTDKSFSKYNQGRYYDQKRCKRSRTQHIQTQQAWTEDNNFIVQAEGGLQQQEEKHLDQTQSYELLREAIKNNHRLIWLEKNSRLKKQSIKQNRNYMMPRESTDLHHVLLQQRKKNISQTKKSFSQTKKCISQTKKYSISKVLSNQQNLSQKQKIILPAHPQNNLKVHKVSIKQNSPFAQQQFIKQSKHLRQKNLMTNKTSGCIKDRKKQYIFQSRSQKRELSQFLKRKGRFVEEQITMEPWNLNGNEKQNDQNQQNDFIMRNHR